MGPRILGSSPAISQLCLPPCLIPGSSTGINGVRMNRWVKLRKRLSAFKGKAGSVYSDAGADRDCYALYFFLNFHKSL